MQNADLFSHRDDRAYHEPRTSPSGRLIRRHRPRVSRHRPQGELKRAPPQQDNPRTPLASMIADARRVRDRLNAGRHSPNHA